MIFSSIQFLIFFFVFIIFIYFLKRSQRSLIIIFSLFFYGYWNPTFVPLILFFMLSSYYFIKNDVNLKISIPITLIPLFYFKYSLFISNILSSDFLIELSYKNSLPLAISFITFTAIAILVDIKTKKFNEKINFFSLSEFLVYFPQLIAGPILRANELIPLLKNKINFSNENIRFGILLFTVGFIKKIFLADSIAFLIDPIFENPNSVNPGDHLKAFLLFPLQIYFDFSGYVDMALGTSKILSINLPINFNKPYLSKSLTEFWRNWHITLSSWFRDYVYIPLGGSKEGSNKLFMNLILTMSVAGLWHGASVNFILWGALNGLFLFLEKKIKLNLNLNGFIKIFITCFIIFNLWVVFRINELQFIFDFYTRLYSDFIEIFQINNLILIFIIVISVYSQKYDNFNFIEEFSKKTKLSVLIPLVIVIILTGLAINTGTSEKFIYFDF